MATVAGAYMLILQSGAYSGPIPFWLFIMQCMTMLFCLAMIAYLIWCEVSGRDP
jgi:hypothetical protein